MENSLKLIELSSINKVSLVYHGILRFTDKSLIATVKQNIIQK